MPIITAKRGLKLFRSDKTSPPLKWTSYFTTYHYDEMGPKNKADLFFFTDNVDIAHSIGTEYQQEEYYLTETELISENCKFLDLSEHPIMFGILSEFEALELLEPLRGFQTYTDPEGNETFIKMVDIYMKFKEQLGVNIMDITLEPAFANNTNFLAQRLSDFDNGPKLKTMLKEKQLDGYCWREFNDPRGLTYCLFDAAHLSLPVMNVVKNNSPHDCNGTD